MRALKCAQRGQLNPDVRYLVMRLHTLFLVLVAALNGAPAIAADEPLANLIDDYRKQPHTVTAPVSVTARVSIVRFRL